MTNVEGPNNDWTCRDPESNEFRPDPDMDSLKTPETEEIRRLFENLMDITKETPDISKKSNQLKPTDILEMTPSKENPEEWTYENTDEWIYEDPDSLLNKLVEKIRNTFGRKKSTEKNFRWHNEVSKLTKEEIERLKQYNRS